MVKLTGSEADKLFEINQRLSSIASPVLRLQAILQFSQIVDILSLGDTGSERLNELVFENDLLREKLHSLGCED